VAGDDFALAVVGDTDWAWDIDAVVAALASTWTQAQVLGHYPIPGTKFRACMYLPDPQAGRDMEVMVHEFGKMIGLEYGSPEGSAEFVTWVLNPLPTPDDVTVQLFEWGPTPQEPAASLVGQRGSR
jgi:hypothetical protein